MGHEVTVFGVASNKSDVELQRLAWSGSKVGIFAGRGPEKFGYAPEMRAHVFAVCPDIVHLHGLWQHPGSVVSEWSRITGGSFVVSSHGMLAPAALQFGRLKKRIAMATFSKGIFTRSAAFHATSLTELDDIRRLGLEMPILLCHHGINLPPPHIEFTKVPSKRRTVLSLGRLHPVKGLDTLLNAWAQIEPRFPDWELKIVGPDEQKYRSFLQSTAEGLGLRRVKFGDPVYGVEKESLMASADLFVLSSLSENFGLTVAESLALGVPVIATKGTPWEGLNEFGCGWWIDHGQQSLSTALSEAILMSTQERRAMGARGREWMARDFSWRKVAEIYVEAYSWLLGGGCRPDYVRVK
jgi:glycosyltransferase involved in cell wall biosynthesis